MWLRGYRFRRPREVPGKREAFAYKTRAPGGGGGGRASRSRRKGIRWHYDPRRGPARVFSHSPPTWLAICVEKNNNVFITRARGTSRTSRQKGASPQSRMDEPVNARSPSPLGRNIALRGDIGATKERKRETKKGRSDFSPVVDIATAGTRKNSGIGPNDRVFRNSSVLLECMRSRQL